jgi:hypothetical protein
VIRRTAASAFGMLALTAAALTGCTSGSSGAHPTTTDSSAARELAHLALQGTTATYGATYVFHLASPDSTATVQVWRAPPNLRVDVLRGTAVGTFLRTARATYSCAVTKGKRSCFTVAKAGQKVPAPFDLGPAALFSDDLQTLSASATSYVVTRATPQPGGGGVPAAQCYAVKAGVLTPQPAVQQGTYCFSAGGAITSVTYPSGNTARMTAMRATAPAAKFVPYAKPAPLPS